MEHLSRARPAPALETGLKGVSLTLDRRVPMT